MQAFRSTKAYDVLVAAPLILFYGFSMAGLQPQFAAAFRLRPVWLSVLQLASLTSDVFYFALVIALVFVRRMPLAKSPDLWPRALALLGANLLLVLPLLPHSSVPPATAAFSAVMTGGATAAELFILSRLGRSFSILPEARRLVTSGPYRRIRHPLYLASVIGSFGAMLQFAQPWALFIVLAAFALQLWRMHYEERVLTKAFPEYAAYASRSWRLLPGLY